MSHPPQKRPRSATPSSFTKGVKDGEYPQAWSQAHENFMETGGLFMTQDQDQPPISEDSMAICSSLRTAECRVPEGTLFQGDLLGSTLRKVRVRNEARVVRDFTPLIVPPAELLYMLDRQRHPKFENIAEELQAPWVCITLRGPQPKPDYVAGIASSAFRDEEWEKLEKCANTNSKGLVTGEMCFPFLICEVKTGTDSIRDAERQSMHAASIAVNALIKLYEEANLRQELDRTILAFSVSHNANEIKLHGHYADLQIGIRYYRHELYRCELGTSSNQEQWRVYKIVMSIYDTFFEKHLERVRHAVSHLPSHSPASVTSGLRLDGGAAVMAPPSQSAGTFAAPSPPSTVQRNRQLETDLAEAEEERRKLGADLADEKEERRKLLSLLLQQQQERKKEEERDREERERDREERERDREERERDREEMAQLKQLIKSLTHESPRL